MLLIHLETRAFLQAISVASSLIEKRNVSAILSSVKIVTSLKDKPSIIIYATDEDIFLQQEIGAKIIENGEFSIPINILLDVVRKIPSQEFAISELENSQILITSTESSKEKFKFVLNQTDSDDFPIMEELNSPYINFTLPSTDMVKILNYTNFSMSYDENRYNLNGLCLSKTGDKISAASMDGHRLSASEIILPDQDSASSGNDFNVILPTKTVMELTKILSNINDDISIFVTENKIKFVFGGDFNNLLISKLIDGTFPEYKDFIPQEIKFVVKVNKSLFTRVVDRASAITSTEKFRAIKFVFFNNMLEIRASGENKGNSEEFLLSSLEKEDYFDITNLETDQDQNSEQEEMSDQKPIFSVSFNLLYILEVIKAISTEYIELSINDASSPILIRPLDHLDPFGTFVPSEGDSFVIMPVRA